MTLLLGAGAETPVPLRGLWHQYWVSHLLPASTANTRLWGSFVFSSLLTWEILLGEEVGVAAILASIRTIKKKVLWITSIQDLVRDPQLTAGFAFFRCAGTGEMVKDP